MKNVVDRNIAMRILRITRRLRRFAKPLRFRTKIACIKNNVLLFFYFWLDRCFISLIADTCYERAIPSSFFIRKYSGCMSVARESIFFLLWFFFNPLFRKSFPRQMDNTDGLFRQKPRTSKSEKQWSFPFTEGHFDFFCLFFTLTLSLFLSLSLILTHVFFLSPFHTRARACAN